MIVFYILGNGFDLAHGLPTRYGDFMNFVQYFPAFYTNYCNKDLVEEKQTEFLPAPENSGITDDYLRACARYRTIFNPDNIERINSIITDNIWMGYLDELKFNGIKWSDFENEVGKMLVCIQKIFDTNNNDERLDSFIKRFGTHMQCSYHVLTKVKRKMFPEMPKQFVRSVISNENWDNAKSEILEILYNELLNFSECFGLYLTEFVEKMSVIEKKYGNIKENSDIRILNFNYTNTVERVYGVRSEAILHHVHGKCKNKNMVLGTGNAAPDELDFMDFQKYYQRLIKKTGTDYRKWLTEDYQYTVELIGHSIDPADHDILREIFESPNVKYILVHPYDGKDQKQKVKNLIQMLGKGKVEDMISQRKLFIDDPVCHDSN